MFFGYCFLFRFCDVVNRCCSWYISPSSLFFFLETKNHTWPLVCTHFISRLNVLGYTFPSWFSLLFLLTLNLLISNPLVVYVSQDQYRRSSVDTSVSRSRYCRRAIWQADYIYTRSQVSSSPIDRTLFAYPPSIRCSCQSL